jgi:hypothetical protein
MVLSAQPSRKSFFWPTLHNQQEWLKSLCAHQHSEDSKPTMWLGKVLCTQYSWKSTVEPTKWLGKVHCTQYSGKSTVKP